MGLIFLTFTVTPGVDSVRLHPDESSILTGRGRLYQYEALNTGVAPTDINLE